MLRTSSKTVRLCDFTLGVRLRIPAVLLCLLFIALPAYPAGVQLGSLSKGDVAHGFRADTVYLNDAGRPIGARFIHERSGFTLDYLQIESVPQGYTWVNTLLVGDQGEPHTQEHLLVGKGTVGRAFASLDTMWLSGSSAFTGQWRTSYPFNTNAGKDVFFDLFAAELNALLHPNYTDEEIRREVRSFGVTTNPDGTLRLEEKGSVYNEMISSGANKYGVLFRAMSQLTYGKKHPLSYSAGGTPEGIRTMKPEDIRKFHAANYYLANMGTMVAFPKNVPLDEVLTRTDAILKQVEKDPKQRESTTAKPFPAPQAAPAATIAIEEYPHGNDQQPSPLAFVWPATRPRLSIEDQMLLELFADTFSGDAGTNLYKLFVDTETRVLDTGTTGAFSNVERDLGHPVAFALDDVAASNFTTEKITAIRKIITDELARIAAMEDGSAELKEFNDRVLSRVSETERRLANFVNSPPAWGARSTFSAWMDQLLLLDRTPEFRKSLTLAPQVKQVRELLTSKKNVWRDRLPKWQLTGVTPYAVAARPSPSMLEREEKERAARAEAETQRLVKQYAAADVQAALKRYQAEQDAGAAAIEAEAQKIAPASFVSNPPMTLDEQLQFEQKTLKSGVPLVASTFENMSSATIGLALRADGVTREQLRYLSLLPVLMTRSGVIESGKPVPFDEMSERLRKEVLRLESNFSSNMRTGRLELVVRGAGLGPTEARRALDWMSLVLHHPDWRVENLPRLRDAVDQTLASLRNSMQQPEEYWVNNPADGYRMQSNPAYLAAQTFLTRTHNALRLRWLLKEAPAADREALDAWFEKLAAQTGTREELKALAAKPVEGLSPAATALASEVLKDLDLTLIDIPDNSLAADWKYLVHAIHADLMTPPATALEQLDGLRRRLLRRGAARMWVVGSGAMQQMLGSSIEALSASLENGAPAAALAGSTRLVDARVRARDTSVENPVHVGLLAPNMKGGVIITSVPSLHYADFADKEQQLEYLSTRLFSGAGAHGVFLKTIAAGLAYSNGIRGSIQGARIGYYAERTPEIPQTVKFAIDAIKAGERNPRLADYTIAQVFAENRASGTYENRAEAMATDPADNQPPEQVRKFRESILELRKDPQLGNKLFDRKDKVAARILPGYDPSAPIVPGSIFYAIGPDKQLDAWEAYLKTKLVRLYPRDYWIP
jgi:Zn-dependent M16 (insulinase) family peptidase